MDYTNLILFFLIIVPSAIWHEFAHAWMADYLGDDTAKRMGRLTLNPLPHLDLFGTILMPVLLFFISNGTFLFAYAKPVPYNPYNLRNQKTGPALVGLAGPMANLLVAIVFGLLVRFLPGGNFSKLLGTIVYFNILLMVFNLIPIPPLDGSKILYAILPARWASARMFLNRYGFIILLFFIFFAFSLIQPIILVVFKLITGSS